MFSGRWIMEKEQFKFVDNSNSMIQWKQQWYVEISKNPGQLAIQNRNTSYSTLYQKPKDRNKSNLHKVGQQGNYPSA